MLDDVLSELFDFDWPYRDSLTLPEKTLDALERFWSDPRRGSIGRELVADTWDGVVDSLQLLAQGALLGSEGE